MDFLSSNGGEAGLKVSIQIRKGSEIREGVVSLRDESNVRYFVHRLVSLGWQIVQAKKLA
jgi:hypothetical protein